MVVVILVTAVVVGPTLLPRSWLTDRMLGLAVQADSMAGCRLAESPLGILRIWGNVRLEFAGSQICQCFFDGLGIHLDGPVFVICLRRELASVFRPGRVIFLTAPSGKV
eukprot:3118943-Pyramimonas_sp.AAC.1